MGNTAGGTTRKIAGVTRVRPFEWSWERGGQHVKTNNFTSAVPSASSAASGSTVDTETGLLHNVGGANSGTADTDSRAPSEPRSDARSEAIDSRDSTPKVQTGQQRDRGIVMVVDGETKKMPRSNTRESLRASLRVSIVSNLSAGLLTRTSSASAASSARPTPRVVHSPKVPFPKRPRGCKLSSQTWDRLEHLFRLLDTDSSNAVTKEEAKTFFSGAFSQLSVDAMFNEVDNDGDGTITAEEFVKFWLQVKHSGYKESDILDELEELIEGGAWVDWKDGRETSAKSAKFPKRPFMCRLSPALWSRCEELFFVVRGNSADLWITRENAQRFFKGSFSLISAEAMFQTMDANGHGIIRPKDFMCFWTQVKARGYTEEELLSEIDDLVKGGPWVNWQNK